MQKHKIAKIKSFTKRLQCILSVVLMLLMTLSTIPIEAFADENEDNIVMYGLRIAGVRVTKENASDILGNKVFSYDNSTKTLTVNGDYNYDGTLGIIETIGSELNIYVASDSHLTMLPGSGALSITADTTITGPGILTLESGRVAIDIYRGHLTISDADVNVICKSPDPQYAVDIQSGMLSVVNSKFSVTCTNRALAFNYINGKMNLEDCNIITPQDGRFQDGTIVDSAGNIANEVRIGSDSYCTVPNSRILTSEEQVDANDKEIVKGGDLTFTAARNERESGQIVINKAGTYNNLSVTLDDLTLETNSAVKIPASQIEYYFEQYVKIERGYWGLNGLADNGTTPAWYPDALINPDLAHTLGLDCFTLDRITPEGENKQNQGIWFTLNVPKDQKEGKYTGKFKVTFNDADGTLKSFIVPVRVRVYNFTLPTVTENKSKYGSSVYRVGCNKVTAAEEINDKIGIPIYKSEKAPYGGTYCYDGMQHEYQKIVSKFLNERKLSNGYTYGINYSETHFPKEVDELYAFVSSPDTKSPYYSISPNTSEKPIIAPPDYVFEGDDVYKEIVEYFESKVIGKDFSEDEKASLLRAINEIKQEKNAQYIKSTSSPDAIYFYYMISKNKYTIPDYKFQAMDVYSAIIDDIEQNAIKAEMTDEQKQILEEAINATSPVTQDSIVNALEKNQDFNSKILYYMLCDKAIEVPQDVFDSKNLCKAFIEFYTETIISNERDEKEKQALTDSFYSKTENDFIGCTISQFSSKDKFFYYMACENMIEIPDDKLRKDREESVSVGDKIITYLNGYVELSETKKQLIKNAVNGAEAITQDELVNTFKSNDDSDSEQLYYLLCNDYIPCPKNLFKSENIKEAVIGFYKTSIIKQDLTKEQEKSLINALHETHNITLQELVNKTHNSGDYYLDFFYYMLCTQTRINKPNFDKYLEVLIDKSIKEKFDMLKYATVRVPNIDEPHADDFISCCRSLFNAKIVEDSKEHAKEYISNHENCSEELKLELLESVNNLHFIITKHPTQNGYYTDMLLNGLQSVIGDNKTDRYNTIGSYHMASITWERYVQYLDKKEYTKNGKKYTIDTAEIREEWDFNKDSKTDYPTYSLTVPTNFSSGFFCPEFDVLSNKDQNKGEKTRAAATIDNCLNNGIPMWWYCTNLSGENYTLPGNMIDCNRTANKKLNSLAVKRANQWQQYKMGIEGELYWSVDYFCIHRTTPEGKKDKESPAIFKNDIGINAKGYDWSASDGMMIYPVKQLYLNILKKKDENNKVSDADNVAANTIAQKYGYFTSSIRLENIAEGCDDYDYLCLANKLIKEAELINKDIDVTPYIERINKCYDTIFNGIDFDEKANSTNLSNARAKVADVICALNYIVETGYSTLGTSSLGVSFYISPGDQKKMIFRFENEMDKTHHYSDPIYLDFENETASVGSIVKSGSVNSYEYIAFLDDLPMTNTPLSDASFHTLYVKEYEMKDNTLVAKNKNDVNVSDFHRVELAKPVKQFGYEKTRFWNHGLNGSYSNWKSSNKALKFEVKAVTVNDEKGRTNNTANIYFNHANDWGRTTKSIILDPVKGKLMKDNQEIGVVTELDYNWYRFEIPFSELDGEADKAIDMIEAEWINHTFAVNNLEVVTLFQPPTEIRPVNRTVWGDANCDDGVDLSDAVLIMQSIANPNKYGLGGTSPSAITEKGKELADVDTSIKGITGNDALKIQKYLLNLISSLNPIE